MIPKPTIIIISGFDPQALTSLTELALVDLLYSSGFDPQALTSLTRTERTCVQSNRGFDPQALTSLTPSVCAYFLGLEGVSIHRLLRA